jgi:hypothetical protein
MAKWKVGARIKYIEDGATGTVVDCHERSDPDSGAPIGEDVYDAEWDDNGETTSHIESELESA